MEDPRKINELVAIARVARLRIPGSAYQGLPPDMQVWKELSGDDFEHAIEAQLAPANLILSPAVTAASARAADNHCDTNESFWGKVLNEEIRANTTVLLRDFRLFEWFPRSPGLFHTKRGKIARG